MSATLTLRVPTGAPLTNQQVDNNFTSLNTWGNTINSNVGILSNLTTSSTSNVVDAINSLIITFNNTIDSNVGVLSNLTTSSTTNVVAAINTIKSGNLSIFASTTSVQLASIISDETGSGNLVFATSPSLTTPALGAATATTINSTSIPSSKTLVVTTDKLSVHATTSSSELSGIISDETGTGPLVFATSPTLNNPTIASYVENVIAIGTVTSTNTISLTNGTLQTATLTASTACTFTMPTATAGKSFVLLLKQAASVGNGTATFTGVKFGVAGTPTITATAGKMDILTFVSDGTNWYGSTSQGYTP